MNNHADHSRKLLEEIAAGSGKSQRSLAKYLGIALGLTNLLLKRIVRKGWVRMVRVTPTRVAYFITPAGMAEKARMSLDYLADCSRSYASARDRLLDVFCALSEEWSPRDDRCRVVFYGAREISEIGYVCLQSTNLTLVGVVDAARRQSFYGLPVHGPEDLHRNALAGVPFDRLIVMDLDDLAAIEQSLEAAHVPSSLVFWLRDWRWIGPASAERRSGT